MDCSPPGSSVHGVLQAGILEWVAMLSFRGCFQPTVQMMGWKQKKMKKKFWLYFPQEILSWAGVISLEPDWFGSQGWSVLGLRELGACSRQCVSKMDLECLLPSGEPPASRDRQDKLRDWNQHIHINIYQIDNLRYSLNSTGKLIEHTIITYMRKRTRKGIDKCLCVTESSSCNLTQTHQKSTVFQ